MILRVPSYYKTFQCIADKCEHSCCIGWEIDIDEDSYDYYMGIEVVAPFGFMCANTWGLRERLESA